LEKISKVTSRRDIEEALRNNGVSKGDDVMVHASLKTFGYLPNGPIDVINAIDDVIDFNHGTLLMPSHTSQLTDPSDWRSPPVVEPYLAKKISQNIDIFDKYNTPTYGRGTLAEYFRNFKGVVRSNHPLSSVTALGVKKYYYVETHNLNGSEDINSPVGKLYKNNGKIIGFGVESFTALHLAEYIADIPELYSSNPSVLVRKSNKEFIFQKLKKYTKPGNPFDEIKHLLIEAKAFKEYNAGFKMTVLNLKKAVDIYVSFLEK